LHILYIILEDPEDDRIPTPLLNAIIRDLDEVRFKIEERLDSWLFRDVLHERLGSSSDESSSNEDETQQPYLNGNGIHHDVSSEDSDAPR